MARRATTKQKARRTLQGRATTEGRLGKRPAHTPRTNAKKQRKGLEPKMRADG